VPAVALVAPPGLLLGGALAAWGLGCVRFPSRWIALAAGWLSLASLVVVWAARGGQTAEATPPFSSGPIPLTLRLDAVSFAFGLAVLVPAALLLTFQRRTWGEMGAGVLAVAFAVLAAEAGSLVLTTLALGACATLCAAILRQEVAGGTTGMLVAAFVLLVAAAALDVLGGGTSLYSAVPVNALRIQVFLLILVAAALCAGWLPWRTWVSDAWRRPQHEGAGVAVSLLVPLGFLLLMRTYMLGGGAWPSPWLNWLVTALGAAVALGAAIRAQSASDRRSQQGESVPLGGGLALLAMGLGTPLGLVAAITGVLAGAGGVALAVLLPAGGRVALLGVPMIVGVPPGLSFGARLLTVQAALEAAPHMALWALVIGPAWFLGLAAAVRAALLPAGSGRGSRPGALVTSLLLLLAGAGLGGIEILVALPAAGVVMNVAAPPLTGGLTGVLTASGGFGALWLTLPLFVLLLLLTFLTRPLPVPREPDTVEPPLLLLPRGIGDWTRLSRLPGAAPRLEVGRLEHIMAGGHPLLWVAVVLGLIMFITR
jgi:hypothetical protein